MKRPADRDLILVVDDDPLSLELISEYIRSAGYSVETATSAEEAVEKARRLEPTAITLDILLSASNGFSALHQLKSIHNTSSIPVIIISVLDHKTVGFALGAADYLLKPLDRGLLSECLNKHVRSRTETHMKVLAIDDDEAALALVREALEPGGVEVVCFRSGPAALAELRRSSFDAILLDLVMPEMDGFAVLEHVRESPGLQSIPIFVITAHDLTAEEWKILSRQASACFRKDGLWKQMLLREIERVVHRPQSLGVGA